MLAPRIRPGEKRTRMSSYEEWKNAALRELGGTSFAGLPQMFRSHDVDPLYTALSPADEALAKEAHALICEPRPPIDAGHVPSIRQAIDDATGQIHVGPVLALAVHLAEADSRSRQGGEPQIFEVPLGGEIWIEVAKLRALRLGWAKLQVLRKRTPTWAHLIATGASPMLTLREPWVNLLRNAHVVFAAMVGGADDVVLAPFDYGYEPPSELGRRMVDNVRHVLEEEGLLTKVKDPAHGSFAVESLTCTLLREAWKILERIENEGGYPAFVASGALSALYEAESEQRKKELATGLPALTGITSFADHAPEALRGYPTSVLGTPNREKLDWTIEAKGDAR
jgi:hypothetical protein